MRVHFSSLSHLQAFLAMNLQLLPSILTTLVAAASGSGLPHALRGADQVSFLAEHCVGCQPEYCYPFSDAPDYVCYRDGYPKCCHKEKGNPPTTRRRSVSAATIATAAT